MKNLFKRKQKITEKKTRPFYDEDDAMEFISKDSGIDKTIVRKVMNSDLRYQQSVGIIDWNDLEDYISGINKEYNI